MDMKNKFSVFAFFGLSGKNVENCFLFFSSQVIANLHTGGRYSSSKVLLLFFIHSKPELNELMVIIERICCAFEYFYRKSAI